jgi:S-layer protein (TIGR01567 family)
MSINGIFRGRALRIAVGTTILALLLLAGGAGATKSINDNATGGDCTSIGTWNVASKTCTLTTDLTETIEIDSDGITLNGNGHTITGSNTGNGIYLSGRNGVTIKNTNVRNFSEGIYLYSSSSNTLSGNNASSNNNDGIILVSSSNNNVLNGNNAWNNWVGIYLVSDSNTLSGNNVSNNLDGIYLYSSINNMLSGNNAWNNYGIGIGLYYSSNNDIYNNVFNNTNNFYIENSVSTWSITKTPGTNIIDGSYLGGNFWANPSGTGFSQTCTDGNSDGICDSAYTLDSSNIDYLPLAFNAGTGGGSGGSGGGGIGLRGAISDEANKIYSWDARNFPGFWYDLKNGIFSEELRIDPSETLTASDRTIDFDHLFYNTTMQLEQYKANEANYALMVTGGLDYSGIKVPEGGYYAVIGWQGAKYVAVNGKANKLSQLVIEQGEAASDKKTLEIGETWDMGGGYNLTIISIDANALPRQVQFNLTLDGKELVNAVSYQGGLYTYTNDTGGESNVPIFVTYFDSIFAGTASDFVQLRYTWLISTNVTEVTTSDTYGVFKVIDDGTGADHTIKLWNDNGLVNLSSNSTVNIMGNINFSVVDNDSFLRFYPYAEAAVPDVYEARGEVYDGLASGYIPHTRDGIPGWDAFNFAGFWFDPNKGNGGEVMTINNFVSAALASGSSRTIDKDQLFYNTTMQVILYKVNEANASNFVDRGLDSTGTKVSSGGQGTSYGELGWLGEPYVALNGKPNKLSRLVIEQGRSPSDKKVLGVNDTWDIGDGWTLTAQSIDANATPRQAWLVLSKDGVKKDDKIVYQGNVYTYTEKSIAGESDVPLFVTYVDSVFSGASSDMVALRYTWAISTNVTEINTSDTYGVFMVIDDGSGSISHTIKLWNDESDVSLSTGSTVDLAGGMKFRVADNDTALRFYPYMIKTSKISPPVIEITSPSSNSSFLQGEMIMLSGSASGGSGIYNFSWTSSIDGFLGNTSRIPTFTLSQGKHTITLTVMDANGLANSTSTTITVLQSVATDVPGEVYDASGNFPHIGSSVGWSALNFAGFWYDLNEGKMSESLVLTDSANTSLATGTRTIDKDQLFYSSTMQVIQYKVNEANVNNSVDLGLDASGVKMAHGVPAGYYGEIGWLGRPYVALNGKPNKLAALIIEQNISEEKILNIGETWDIGQGYSLTLQDIDAKSYPQQVLLVFSKDGVGKDNRVIYQGQVYTYIENSIAGESDVPTFVTFVDNVTSNSVKLKYTWAVSSSVIEIRPGDTYGVFMVIDDGSGSISHTIKLWNDASSVSLSANSTVVLAGGMKFRVADNDTILKFYPEMAVITGLPSGTSVESSTGKGTVIVNTDTGTVENLTAVNVSDIPEVPPADANLYYGLFRFNITGISPGGSANITLTFPDNLPAGTIYWKYGANATSTTPHWYTIPSTIDGKELTIMLTDGGDGDDDLVANGNIKDDGGPSIPQAGPATFNISGFKLNAADNTGIPDWKIMLLNTTTGLEIENMNTDSTGAYIFTGLVNDTYNVTEEMKSGWTNDSPMSQVIIVNGNDMMKVNFTNRLIQPSKINAIVKITPETLNLASKGVFTAFVTLPHGFNATDINISTVMCDGARALKGTISEKDGGTLILEFDRQDLKVSAGNEVTLKVTGQLFNGVIFEGSDTIRIMVQGSNNIQQDKGQGNDNKGASNIQQDKGKGNDNKGTSNIQQDKGSNNIEQGKDKSKGK